MKYIKGLDVLRAFAMIFVLIWHWGPHKFNHFKYLTIFFTNIIPSGDFGGDLFFTLSGFLITKILLNAKDESFDLNRLQIIKSFYIRRSLRIFPIYFLFIFVFGYLFKDKYVLENIIYYLTYTSNILVLRDNNFISISHTWSLAVEEQFYLIWPWVIIYTLKKYLFKVLFIALFIGLISSIWLNYAYGKYFYILLPPCVTAFSMGALFAYVQDVEKFRNLFIKVLKILLPFCIVLLIVNQFGYKLILSRFIDAIIATNLIIYVTNGNFSLINSLIFKNNLLINLGKISYGAYLYHYMLQQITLKWVIDLQDKFHSLRPILKYWSTTSYPYLFNLIFLLFISTISFQFIEKPILNLKKHFNYIK